MSRWETLPPVHPAALTFDMMESAEIDGMADNIKENGAAPVGLCFGKTIAKRRTAHRDRFLWFCSTGATG